MSRCPKCGAEMNILTNDNLEYLYYPNDDEEYSYCCPICGYSTPDSSYDTTRYRVEKIICGQVGGQADDEIKDTPELQNYLDEYVVR